MRIKEFVHTNPVLQKYLTDFWLKAVISLGSSLVISILYAIWEIISGIYYHSFWFTTLGCYYILLSAIRFLLLKETGREKGAEWEKYRICGISLLFMNLILSGIVVLAVKDQQGSEYAGYLIYVVAFYTFCKITASVRNLVKYRKVHYPVLSASKAVSFASSVVSMLSLEIAMTRQFGDDPLFFQRMTILTGAGACALLSVTAIYMIMTAHKNIACKKTEEADGIKLPHFDIEKESVAMKAIDFTKDWIFYKEGETVRKRVGLPHDAMLYEKREKENPSTGACACFAGGVYHYEKRFPASEELKDKTVQLYFEGVYQNAVVRLNGREAGHCAYGYSAFLVDLCNLKIGEENLIEVIADNSRMPNTRWYSGSGIYRPVTMLVAPRKHIQANGVRISTLSYKPAQICVETALSKEAEDTENIFVFVEVLAQGNVVASGEGKSVQIEIENAMLWSDEEPNLYECRVTLKEKGQVLDQVTESFGIRQIAYSKEGLFINGKKTLLRGGCLHADNGILGAKSYAKSEWRRVRILKEAGYNAIRSSHNPCAIEMLKACDYYGIYVLDESWDMWFNHKNVYDYADYFMENYHFDLQSMVEKDYNHPSVIAYSIGNEVSEPESERGLQLEKEMVAFLRQLDPYRPVSAGINLMILVRQAQGNGIYKQEGGRQEDDGAQNQKDGEKSQGMPPVNSSLVFNQITSMVGAGMNNSAVSEEADRITSPALDALDIAGYNYASGRYPLEGEKHPDRLIFGSETFPQDIGKNWEMVEKYPYLIGDFMWTAWDYLGEAGSGAWGYTEDSLGFEKSYPWLLADMGVIDILGNPNGELYQAQAVWKKLKKPMIAVQPVNHPGEVPAKSVWRGSNAIPSWSWKGCQGNEAIVEVYFDAPLIILSLNGQEIGRQKPVYGKASFVTAYAEGRLEAVALNENETEIARNALQSADRESGISVFPEETSVAEGDILYVTIQIADRNGIVESNADRKLSVTVTGGELIGFGSANPRTEESFVTGTYTTYYGRAQAVVKAGHSEQVRILVQDGNTSVEKEIRICATVQNAGRLSACVSGFPVG